MMIRGSGLYRGGGGGEGDYSLSLSLSLTLYLTHSVTHSPEESLLHGRTLIGKEHGGYFSLV